MAVHFHKLMVTDTRHETPDCVSVAFYIPEELTKEFTFNHGQNITLKAIINGEEMRRPYSICSSPFENELRIAVKKQGIFSQYINNGLKPGDYLDVLPPTGKFNTPLDKKNKKNYLAFAAGSGITPVISIIKTTLKTEPDSSFTLVYSNRSRHSIIFFEALEALKNKNITRFNLIYIFSREATEAKINSGRIDIKKLDELSKLIDYKGIDEFFICGPQEMIFCTRDFLQQSAIDKAKIHFELFTVPGEQKTVMPVADKSSADEKSHINIKADGRMIDFDLPPGGMSILDAALFQGADLPFACKGGVCGSCKAKLVEGKVIMDNNYALEQEEVEKGFILCCQSHPQSKNIVIDFDAR